MNSIGKIIKSTFSGSGKFLAYAFSISALLFFSMALAIQFMTMWLNSQNGSQWINKEINSVLDKNGYGAKLEEFDFAWPMGIGIAHLEIYTTKDKQVIASGKDIKLSSGLVSFIFREAAIHIRAKNITIQNIPLNDNQPPENNPVTAPILIPDLFFTKAYLKIDIDKLDLSENLVPDGFSTSLSYIHSIRLDQKTIHSLGELTLKNTHSIHAPFIPHTVRYDASLNLDNGIITISSLLTQAAAWDSHTNGSYAITDSTISFDTLSKINHPEKDIHTTLSRPIDLSLSIKGTANNAIGHIDLSSEFDKKPLSLGGSFDLFEQKISFKEITGEIAENPLSGNLDFGWGHDDGINGQLSIAFENLKFFNEFKPGLNLDGQGNISVLLEKPAGKPQLATLKGDFKNISYDGEEISTLTFTAKQEKGVPHLSFSASKKRPRDFTLSGSLLLSDLEKQNIDLKEIKAKTGQGELKITGKIAPDLIALNLFARSFDVKEIPFSGLSDFPLILNKATATLSGNFAAPALHFNGDWTTSQKGGNDATITSTITYNGTNLDIDLSGTGRGIKNLTGFATLPLQWAIDPYQFTTGTINGALKADINLGSLLRHVPMNSFGVAGHVALDLKITSNTKETYLLSGFINPGKIQIDLPNRFNADIPHLNIVSKKGERESESAKNILMDIAFNAPNQIFVRGWGLDTELSGQLKITGAITKPDIQGNFTSIRGRYEEFGKKFNLDRVLLTFQGAVPPSPYLDIVASTDAGDATAKILINGNAQEPTIKLASTPELPQDEILSRILFGKNSSKISPFQAIQLAQALQKFSGGSTGTTLFDPIGTLREITGLDDITVEGVGTKESKISAGKYITDKVYVDVKRGAAENSGAASVKVKVTPKISVESSANQNGSAGGSLFWEWEY